MEASDLKRTNELEAELSQLKRMYADLALQNRAMNDLITKNCRAGREGGSGRLPSRDPCSATDQTGRSDHAEKKQVPTEHLVRSALSRLGA